MALVHSWTGTPEDATDHRFVKEGRTDDMLDFAEKQSVKEGRWFIVSTDRGRVLARFSPEGEFEYLGY